MLSSIVADLNHNVIYKPLLPASPLEQSHIVELQAEATAREQVDLINQSATGGTDQDADSSSDSTGQQLIATGWIAAIVAGSVACLAIVVGACVGAKRHRRRLAGAVAQSAESGAQPLSDIRSDDSAAADHYARLQD